MSTLESHNLVLYHAWMSSCSRKVRLCLAEKNLPYQSKPIKLHKFEHHTPEYLALNPNGVVPVLIHNGIPLIESTIINEYLDQISPEVPLRPSDAMERAIMRVWCKLIDDVCLPALLVQNWSRYMHPIAREWTDEELAKRLASVPTRQRRYEWERQARNPYTQEEIEMYMDDLRGVVTKMEDTLAHKHWLAGDAYSLADCNMTPYLVRIEELDPTQTDPAYHPHTADWWRRIKARPSFEAASILPMNP